MGSRTNLRSPQPQARQYQHQATAQLSMLHRRSPPHTPLAMASSSYREPADDPAYMPGADTNVASLYAGGGGGSNSVGSSSSNYSPHYTPPGAAAMSRMKGARSRSDPLFGRSGARSSVAQPQRLENDDDEREIDPVHDGALQFVPAFARADRDLEGASWDAILGAEEKKLEEATRMPRARSAIVTPTANSRHTRSHSAGRRSPFPRKYADAAQKQSSAGKISRIKSIFNHRAAARGASCSNSEVGPASSSQNNNRNNSNNKLRVTDSYRSDVGVALRSTSVRARAQSLERRSQQQQQQQQQHYAPPSPAQSSGSSAYVGWPGTQDASGKTVTVSSYDDSSTAGPAAAPLATNEASLVKEAEQHMSRWTAQTSAMTDESNNMSHLLDDSNDAERSSPFPSPIRKSNLDTSSFSFDEADFHPQTAAEFHLAAAVADAHARSETNRLEISFDSNASTELVTQSDSVLSRPIPLTRSQGTASSRISRRSSRPKSPPPPQPVGDQNISPGGGRPVTSHQFSKQFTEWGTPSESPAASKSSSAYFNAREVSKMSLAYPDLTATPPPHYAGPVDLDDPPPEDDNSKDDLRPTATSSSSRKVSPAAYHPYNDRLRKDAAAAAANVLRGQNTNKPQPPTEDALQRNNQQFPQRNFATPTAKGFRGLLDKTKEVPCLMDGLDSDSLSSSKATSVVSSGPSNSGAKHGKNHREFLRNLYDTSDGDVTVSDVFDGISVTKESDVFDNLSFGGSSETRPSPRISRHRSAYPERIAEEDDSNLNTSGASNEDAFSFVMLGGGLTAIQTSPEDYQKRKTGSDFDNDGNMTNSDVSSNGYGVRIPGFHEMLSAGKGGDSSLRGIQGNLGAQPRNAKSRAAVARSTPKALFPHSPWPETDAAPQSQEQATSSDSVASGSSSSDGSSFFSDPYRDESGLDVDGDLSEYYIHPSVMKKVLRKFRQFSENDSKMGFAEFERAEDNRQVFALFEMRSRIMEKDIERGLERRGGTAVVDDLVLTPYNQTAHRIRDAVIVSKAWRDGATVVDVIKSALLTRRAERSFFIRRPVAGNDRSGRGSRHSQRTVKRYTWEARKWVDDADFMQYRCPSLGSRHMWGGQIFTIGDCQSMLLKLTNERCMELRGELNAAMARQITAEDALSQEKGGGEYDGMMTEAEMTYLAAMEEVKTISKKLVGAEQAFTLVRERIQNLISRYQSMLLKIENESFTAASSVVTYESSYVSNYDSSEYWNEQEQIWARRARRAEIKAELSARQAALAKQETRSIMEEKLKEISILQKKLDELQSVHSSATEDNEKAAVARNFNVQQTSTPATQESTPSMIQSAKYLSKEKLDDVKQRFRDRMAARKQQDQHKAAVEAASRAPLYPSAHATQRSAPRRTHKSQAERELIMSAGEEMCQQMDFYERSLKAVDTARAI